jgi:hypothetical protein
MQLGRRRLGEMMREQPKPEAKIRFTDRRNGG